MIYTPAQVAEQFGVSIETVYAWIHAGDLEATDVSAGAKPRWRIDRRAVARFKQSRQRAPRSGVRRRRRVEPELMESLDRQIAGRGSKRRRESA